MDDRSAGKYFDTAPQAEDPLDSSWRDAGYSQHNGPLVLKPGDRKVTMTLDDLLDIDYRVKSRESDDLIATIARVKISDIMSE